MRARILITQLLTRLWKPNDTK